MRAGIVVGMLAYWHQHLAQITNGPYEGTSFVLVQTGSHNEMEVRSSLRDAHIEHTVNRGHLEHDRKIE